MHVGHLHDVAAVRAVLPMLLSSTHALYCSKLLLVMLRSCPGSASRVACLELTGGACTGGEVRCAVLGQFEAEVT